MASPSHSRDTVRKKYYEVFLSFCGKDTRPNFTDHLYEALKRKGIVSFRDNDELMRGAEISSGLSRAIEASGFCVVVLSKSYAFSSWCLTELAKIVECKKQENTILPVFYNVDPSNVRKLGEDFKIAFEEHDKKIKNDIDKEKVERWRAAFQKVGYFHGWDSRVYRYETVLIKDIVEDIFQRLDLYLFSSIPKDIVGINHQVKKLIYEYLQVGLDGFRFIGICGMGGIGKTTIARALYQMLSNRYEDRCFLANVRDRSKQKGLGYLQKRLLSDVLKESNLKIGDVLEGTNLIKRRLFEREVFVVLDDVDEEEQVKALAQAEWFNSNSRVIITTRDKHLLIQNGVKEEHIYNVELLCDDDALKLLRLQAFKHKEETDDHVKLSYQITNYAKGLPLTLKVLGSFLCDSSVNEWQSTLDKLKNYPSEEIMEVLGISYKGLDKISKEVFLDIACFFKGKNKSRVKEILQYKYDFDLEIVIQELIEKHLITVSNCKIWMHDMIQEMGKKIVREKNPDNPREKNPDNPSKQARLWSNKDVNKVLQQENMGTCPIEGIMLNNPEKKDITNFKGKAFSNITNLRLLKIITTDGQHSEDLEYLSNELRFLKWRGYPFKSLPSGFHPENLGELNMCNSHIECLLEGMKILKKLKIIKLSNSCRLISIPNFRSVPNLERLDLEGCRSLVHVQQSIGSLRKLTELNLKNCSSLESIPSSVCGLPSLKILNLNGCAKLEKLPPNLGKAKLLEELDIRGTAISRVKFSIPLEELRTLKLGHSGKLSGTPDFTKVPNLERLDLEGSINLLEVHQSVGFLRKLTLLNLKKCQSLVSIPSSICSLPSLKILNLDGCTKLDKLPENLGEVELLEELDISRTAISQLTFSTSFKNLKIFKFSHSRKLIRTPDFTKVPNLERLDLEGCISLQEFRQSVGSLRKLTELNLENCKSLASFTISECGLPSLKLLNLDGCSKLDNLSENLGKSALLEKLYVNLIALGQVPSSILQLRKKSLIELRVRFEEQLPRTSFFLSVSKSQRRSQSTCLFAPPAALCLTKVDLGGCNLSELAIPNITILETIKHLSELKVLPQCQPIVSARAEGFKSLKKLPGTLLYLCNPRKTALQFFSSFNLAENDDWKSNLSKIFLKRWFQEFPNGCSQSFVTCLPGSKIPIMWFTHSAEGNSITIELPPDQANAKFMGFAVCAVFSMPPNCLSEEQLMLMVSCHSKVGSSSFGVEFSIPSFIRIESDCLCLGYLSKTKIICEDYIFPGGDVHVKFRIVDRSRSWNTFVKGCGILPVFDKQNIEYLPAAEDSIMEHDKLGPGWQSSSRICMPEEWGTLERDEDTEPSPSDPPEEEESPLIHKYEKVENTVSSGSNPFDEEESQSFLNNFSWSMHDALKGKLVGDEQQVTKKRKHVEEKYNLERCSYATQVENMEKVFGSNEKAQETQQGPTQTLQTQHQANDKAEEYNTILQTILNQMAANQAEMLQKYDAHSQEIQQLRHEVQGLRNEVKDLRETLFESYNKVQDADHL